jgi:membrane fusion protein (multidrug efflux system)
VSAYVRRLHADIGDHVQQGQVLADLDAPELTAALNEALSKQKAAEAVLQSSRGTYRRLRQTARTAGAVAPMQLEQARIQVITDSLNIAATRAHYRAAEQFTNYLHLKAPFAGVITEHNLSPGAAVETSEATVLPLPPASACSCTRSLYSRNAPGWPSGLYRKVIPRSHIRGPYQPHCR